MALPRRDQIDPEIATHYHLIARCVRRAFLCGKDRFTGKSFEHRRDWIVQRLALLAEVFAIDLCAYAIMSTHYHLVVRLASDRAEAWSDDEVVSRWCRIYGKPEVICAAGLTEADEHMLKAAAAKIKQLRDRLQDISWFMKCLNEFIARQANAEDHCSGAFWEGRYKSQALVDERAVLACMAYVDLNPIRARTALTPEASDFTSIQARIGKPEKSPVPLIPFADAPEEKSPSAPLPISRDDYLELVDWSGRAVLTGKRGAIPDSLPPILQRLSMTPATWAQSMTLFRHAELRFLGSGDALRQIAQRLSRQWFKGAIACRAIFGSA